MTEDRDKPTRRVPLLCRVAGCWRLAVNGKTRCERHGWGRSTLCGFPLSTKTGALDK